MAEELPEEFVKALVEAYEDGENLRLEVDMLPEKFTPNRLFVMIQRKAENEVAGEGVTDPEKAHRDELVVIARYIRDLQDILVEEMNAILRPPRKEEG